MIIVGTSLLIAMLLKEADAERFASILSRADESSVAAPTYFETMLVAFAKRGAIGRADVTDFLRSFDILVVPWTATLAEGAADAYQRFGKGQHRAALNFGDCMAYALAKSLDAPLLYKGNDFALTDIRSAI